MSRSGSVRASNTDSDRSQKNETNKCETDEKLQAAQEVGFLDCFAAGFSGALDDLGALFETVGGIGHSVVLGSVTVIRRGCDIVSVVVGGDFGREDRGASGQLLLVALPLLLVQGCTAMRLVLVRT